MDCAVAYAKQRKSFDQPISSLYAVQEKLSNMSVKIDAARLLIFKVRSAIAIAIDVQPVHVLSNAMRWYLTGRHVEGCWQAVHQGRRPG